MAEVAAARMSLWPRLRKWVGGAKKQSVGNPYASEGLEKFAVMVAELQAKNASLVEKTGNSVSAARYLSRSAQEWTADALTRTAGRRRERDSSRAPARELVLIHPAEKPALAAQGSCDLEEPRKGFSNAEFQKDGAPARSGDSTEDGRLLFEGFRFTSTESQASERPIPTVGETGISVSQAHSPEIQTDRIPSSALHSVHTMGVGSKEGERTEEQIVLSGVKPEKDVVGLPLITARSSKKNREAARSGGKGWKSVIAVLVALSAFLASRMAEAGTPIVAAVTFSVVIRKWHKGKLCAEFVLSSMARHLLTPLQSYLSVRVPRRLTSLPAPRNAEEDAQEQARLSVLKASAAEPEIQAVHDRIASFGFPGLPLEPSLPSPGGFSAPAPIVLSPDSEIEVSASIPGSPQYSLSPTSSIDSSASSASKRPRKKLTLKLREKFLRSSHTGRVAPGEISFSAPVSPPSQYSMPSFRESSHCPRKLDVETRSIFPSEARDSSPAKHKRFCRRRGKSAVPSTVDGPDESRTQTTEAKSSCILRMGGVRKLKTRPTPADHVELKPIMVRRSNLSRMSSPEPEEFGNIMAVASTHGTKAIGMTLPQIAEDSKEKKVDVWPAVLVTLLFLMWGQVPAILATSFFFLIISRVSKDRSQRSHSRQVRDLDGGRNRAQEAARKLQRSPLTSPRKGDLTTNEFQRRDARKSTI